MKKRKSLLRSDSFQTLLTSLLCIILGVAIGYVVLLIINPAGAWKSMSALLKNFFHYPAGKLRMKYFGQTLVRTAPLLMCALSILFAYKVGMFNIGAAGQYVAGACVGLYAAIAWQLPWYLCLLLAIAAGRIDRGDSRVGQLRRCHLYRFPGLWSFGGRNRRRRGSRPFVRGDCRFAAIQNLAPFLFETEGRFLCDARTGAAECPCRRYGNDRFAPGPDGQGGDRR